MISFPISAFILRKAIRIFNGGENQIDKRIAIPTLVEAMRISLVVTTILQAVFMFFWIFIVPILIVYLRPENVNIALLIFTILFNVMLAYFIYGGVLSFWLSIKLKSALAIVIIDFIVRPIVFVFLAFMIWFLLFVVTMIDVYILNNP